MSAPNPQVGAVGLELAVHFQSIAVDENGVETASNIDISSASSISILLKKPGSAGTVLTKTGVLDTTGTDGIAKYVTVANDLDTAGVWSIQGIAVVGSKTHKTEVTRFEVERNIS